jgi:AraC-like DNA-binding protein
MINYWAIFFLIAAGQGLFLSVSLLLRQTYRYGFLAMLIFSFSLTLGHYVTFWAGLFSKYPHLIGLSSPLPWLFGPALYFYIKQSQSQQKLSFTFTSLLHFTPFFLHFFYLIPFYLSSATNKLTKASSSTLYHLENLIINWGQTIGLLFYGGIILYNVLKNEDKKASKPLLYMGWLFVGFALSHASYYMMVYGYSYVKIYDYYISVFMSVFIYCVGYMGFLKPDIVATPPHKTLTVNTVKSSIKPVKYAHSVLTDHHAQQLLEKLRLLMQSEKLYLNPALKMQDVADKMGISAHHLSQLLNEQTQQNYAAFINAYRVEAATKKLQNPQYAHEKIIAIAYDVGFNTKASFNAHFKKQTGVSPSIYRQQFLDKTLLKND